MKVVANVAWVRGVNANSIPHMDLVFTLVSYGSGLLLQQGTSDSTNQDGEVLNDAEL